MNAIPYTMYVNPKVKIGLMYMDDCLRGTVEFIETSNSLLSRRVYNFNGLSTTPEDYVKEVKKYKKFIKF